MNPLDIIRQKLMSLHPISLEIFDDSEKHRGHAGYSSIAPSHVRIHIKSEAFKDMTRLEIHRTIYSLLKAELDAGLHSVVIKTS